MSQPSPHSDRPVSDEEGDRLGRFGFAQSIAQQVARLPAEECYVLALEGAWGSGKTSVLRLIEHALTDSAICVRFNPWLFGSQEELLQQFFGELRAAVGGDGAGKQVGDALAKYCNLLSPLQKVPFFAIGDVSKAVTEGGKLVGSLLRGDASVEAERRTLEDLLAKLPKPVVIFCDDLDRLQPGEAREVVRLVRLVADFPQTRYVLAYDRDRLAMALGGQKEGEAYLEKVVQLTYPMPAVNRALMRRFTLGELDQALQGVKHREVDRARFAQCYSRIIEPMVKTPRDVRRLVNAVIFAIQSLGEEVALEDLVTVEALRCFLPGVYSQLAEFAYMLAAGPQSDASAESFRERRQEALTQLRARAGDRRHLLDELLDQIFPITQRNYYYSADNYAEWRAARRLAHIDVLRIFLEKGVPSGELDTSFVEQVVRCLPDEVALRHVLADLDEDELERLLERLSDHVSDIPQAGVEPGATVFLSILERLREETRHLFDLGGAKIRLTGFILRLLRRAPPADAPGLVQRVYNRTPSLSARRELVRIVGHSKGAGHRLVDEPTWHGLRDQLRADMLAAGVSKLADERFLCALLFEFHEDASIQGLISSGLSDDEFLRALLRSGLSESYSWTIGSATQDKKYTLPWKGLGHMVDPSALKTAVEALDVDVGDERTRLAVTAAKEYAAGRDDARDDEV